MTMPVQELNALLNSYRYLIKRSRAGDSEARILTKHFPYESSLVEIWSPRISAHEWSMYPDLRRRVADLLG